MTVFARLWLWLRMLMPQRPVLWQRCTIHQVIHSIEVEPGWISQVLYHLLLLDCAEVMGRSLHALNDLILQLSRGVSPLDASVMFPSLSEQ